ncbi:ethylbenzene dehydrogenase-related protein [uncultured Gimesia sp.]|uniref:ethylbenzene dehydrogenase-related protein n=1 Tax=uncultured Gimesia sp. TaxID=1678688 RepID=UPI002629E9F0|nr:ethylbenzene dehydrogenase-related protein [uncultured Gimesia sp.]
MAVGFSPLSTGGCSRNSHPAQPAPSPSTTTSENSTVNNKADNNSSSKEDAVAFSLSVPVLIKHVASADIGKKLYKQHCAACHGQSGDGKGIAAPFLFPKPRNFTTGKFRLVSTKNRVPSKEDLEAILHRGMPGSAMPPFAHLKEGELKALVEEVQRLFQDGLRNRYILALKEEEELTDEEIAAEDVQQEIEEFIQLRTTVGPTREVPHIDASDEAAIARGKILYLKKGCNKCHGDTAVGDGLQKMVDDDGYPTRPRDLTRGIFKGGHDVASLYRRIAYGMPGTPMPSSETALKPQEMIDLVHFTLSLSNEEQRQRSILKRQQLTATAVHRLPQTATDSGWSASESVRLNMLPLWWRDNSDPDLQIQALHDGKNIAIRISWQDKTEDRHSARNESFKDAVALELYRGNEEPFVGMGNKKSPIDIWFWDADHQGNPITIKDVYPNTVVDRYPFNEKVVTDPEFDRVGTQTANQPRISLPARASGNPNFPKSGGTGASSLTTNGPGSVTFRIPKSQIVKAQGIYAAERRTVMMTRTLAVNSTSEGIGLKPGDNVSIAFAVWDGSQQDRDGKKLITMWHDLKLEK